MTKAQHKYHFKDSFLTNTVCQPLQTNAFRRTFSTAKTHFAFIFIWSDLNGAQMRLLTKSGSSSSKRWIASEEQKNKRSKQFPRWSCFCIRSVATCTWEDLFFYERTSTTLRQLLLLRNQEERTQWDSSFSSVIIKS